MEEPAPDPLDKPLIAARRPATIRAWTRLGRIIAKLHGMRAAYRYWYGHGARRELSGSGRLQVEITERELRCRVLGDLFKPGPCEFVFHQFWLTRRGMILAVFDLAENRPPESHAASETFLQISDIRDAAIRREAALFRANFRRKKKRTPP
jgi:hypothetical protein